MANYEEHLHHMARRHHATMQKLNGLQAKFMGYAQKSFGLLETGAGAWAGGVIEGRTKDMSGIGSLPVNLLVGAGLLLAGYANLGGEKYSEHFENFGNGFVASYLGAAGYAFGKRWADTGKFLGGGESRFSWGNPYEAAVPPMPPPAVNGDLTDEQMAAIIANMEAAARAPAYP